MKASAIPCPHQAPTRGDNTVSVAQGGTATPGATKQVVSLDRLLTRLDCLIATDCSVCGYLCIYNFIMPVHPGCPPSPQPT